MYTKSKRKNLIKRNHDIDILNFYCIKIQLDQRDARDFLTTYFQLNLLNANFEAVNKDKYLLSLKS